MIRRREDSSWESTSSLCKSPGADKIHHNPSFSSCNWFFTWHSNHKFAWATRLPYGEATELFTSLRKLWGVFKTLCPGAWEICYPSVWPHKPESKSQWCQKSSGYLHKREETSRTSPLYQHTKRVASQRWYPGCETWPKRNATMGYWAWKSDAMHQKGFCGNTSLKDVRKELRVRERVELEYNDTKGTQKKTEELLLTLTEMWVEICC